MRRFHFALLALVLLVAQPLLAKTYYVGTCKTGAYPTISAAVAAVPAGSVIDVCPGTYPEQVVISQPLTLQAYASGGSDQVVIAMPSAGLTTTTSLSWGTVAAQVEVTAGPVNITGITVDGTATSSVCPTVWDIGIHYNSGSSGTIDAVQTSNQNCNNFGTGIYAENETATPLTITIENSGVTGTTQWGIDTCGGLIPPSTLTATIKNNYVANVDIGINTDCYTIGTVTGNVVDAATYIGISAVSGSGTVTGNTVTNSPQGIMLGGYVGSKILDNTVVDAATGIVVNQVGTVDGNHIVSSNTALYFGASGATVEDNLIMQTQAGAVFECYSATMSGNTFNGALTGFEVYAGTSTGTNKFYNVAAVTTGGCTASAARP